MGLISGAGVGGVIFFFVLNSIIDYKWWWYYPLRKCRRGHLGIRGFIHFNMLLLASSRLCRLGLDSDKLKAIYILPFRLTKDTKLCMFRYKIIHNILLYGSKLYKMKMSNSPLCVHCNSLETLPHMLVNCTEINSFWAKIISCWNHQSGDCYLVDELSILYGYNPEDKRNLIFNYFFLLVKETHFYSEIRTEDP